MQQIRSCIDFLITQKCNYRCTYCSQSKKFYKGAKAADDKTIDAFLNFIKIIDKTFEITISGGEPLTHPRFYEVIKEIKNQGLKLTVISNFSYNIENYKKIADIMGENLIELFVSYHPTQVSDIENFKQKAKEFNLYKNKTTKFSVASVLTNGNIQHLKELSEFLNNNGIKFGLQHMRIKNKYVKYSKTAEEFLAKNAAKEPGEVTKTFGKLCHAGEKFLFIYENGDVYRCYSSRFNKTHCMGNIKDKGFKLFTCAKPCMNTKCTCPKPISYNMLDLKRNNYLLAGVYLVKNLIYLPLLVLKNKDILKAKFRQAAIFKKNI